jgi:hypothetical protein
MYGPGRPPLCAMPLDPIERLRPISDTAIDYMSLVQYIPTILNFAQSQHVDGVKLGWPPARLGYLESSLRETLE